MNIDDLLDEFDGPTVADTLRESRRDELLQKVLEALASPAPAAQVTVNPVIEAPKAPDVVVNNQGAKPVSWTFEFERNGDGTIKRIHATVKE